MSNLSDILKDRKVTIVKTTGLNNLKPIVKTTVNCKGYKCTVEQVDILVDDAIAKQVAVPSMRAWHCKMAYQLGSEIYIRCMGQAREGKSPAKLFTWLLNQALAKQEWSGEPRQD